MDHNKMEDRVGQITKVHETGTNPGSFERPAIPRCRYAYRCGIFQKARQQNAKETREKKPGQESGSNRQRRKKDGKTVD